MATSQNMRNRKHRNKHNQNKQPGQKLILTKNRKRFFAYVKIFMVLR